jgi:hypothetical protein
MTIIISLLILLTYTTLVCTKYGIPTSLSDSYYYIGWKPIFTLTMWVCGILVLPKCMDMAATTQIVPFLAISGIFLVGAAPRVREYERKIHIVGATTSGIFSQLWVILYGTPISLLSWIIPGEIVLWCIFNRGNKKLIETIDSKNIVFWCEVSCFTSLFISLLK